MTDQTPECSARIKLHRYSAFSDIPVFTKRYCDLKQAPSNLDLGFVDDLVQWLTSCACDQSQPQPPDSSNLPSTPSSSTDHLTDPVNPTTLPFTKHESSLLCLTSALTIARAFESLPYPVPSPPTKSATNNTNQTIPRTLPSFACCAMQAAYALLMVCNQAWAMQSTGAMILQVDHSSHGHYHQESCNGSNGGGNATQPAKLLAQCEQGLYSILGTLENYSVAFEAIAGMRGEFLPAFCGNVRACGLLTLMFFRSSSRGD